MAEPTEKKSLYKKIKERQAQMADVRRPYEDVRKEVIEMLRPELSLWGDTGAESKGKKRGLKVYNGSPIEALQNATDGMQGHLASASLDWFTYTLPNPEHNEIPDARQWLQDGEEIIYSVFRESNFYSVLNRVFRNALSVGDGCIFIEENREASGIACSTFHPRELFITEDPNGQINGWHREFYLTAANAAEKFGKEKLSQALQDNVANNPQTRSKFLHAICRSEDPIFDGESGIPDRPWISMYIEAGATGDEKKPLRISGYWSFPAPYWRLEKASDSVYGWGTGCSALIDIYALNSVTKTNMDAGNLRVAPPIIAPMELKGRVNILPNGRTWTTTPGQAQEVRELLKGVDYPVGVDREDRLQMAIDKLFNVDFFLLLTRSEKPMTATEIIEKTGERSLLLGPKIGRLESDLLNPIHDRVFEIAQSNGWLPEPPDILLEQGDRIDVQYNGPLAQAQRRLFETRRSAMVLADVAPYIEAFPETLDNLDGDKSVRRTLRDGGHPEDEIRSEEERDEIRERRQRALEAQQQLEIAERAAKVSPGLTKAPEPGSIMEKIGA